MTPEELFQKVKDLPEPERQVAVRDFLATVDEDAFTQEMLGWGDDIQQWMDSTQKKIDIIDIRKCLRVGN